MQLTSYLCRLSNFIRFDRIPGDILRGKHRIWPKLNIKYKRHLLRRIDMEIDNMKHLSKPFLTQEESEMINHKLEIERQQKEEYEAYIKHRSNKNKLEDRLISDHFKHLKAYRTWE